MVIGYNQYHLAALLLWALASVLSLVLYRMWGHKLFLAFSPLVAMTASGVELYKYTLRPDPVDMGCFFLFVLSLMHLFFAMMIDERATTWATKFASGMGLVVAAFAYFTDNIFVFGFFWILSVIPAYVVFDPIQHQRARAVFIGHHVLSFVCLAVGMMLLQVDSGGFSSMRLVGELPHTMTVTIGGILLVGASLIRQAMFPFHLWFKAAYKTKPFPLAIGLYSMNLGFLLFLRLGLPIFQQEAGDLFPYAMVCGVLSSLYFANMALVQTRILSTVFNVMLAQYATLYCGLETASRFGKAGVVFQFITIGCAFAGLISCLYAIEWHVGSLRAQRFHGLQHKNPTLAVIFLLFALSACALPFTMGFAGEDLIFHAVIERYPLVGLGLILTAAINGVAMFKSVTFIFRGQRSDLMDATIQLSTLQKAALGTILLVMFVFGCFPSLLLTKILAFI